jgi:8-oxo-dGTP diphosphatase
MGKSKYFKLISAVHLFFIEDNRILLLRRANTGYEDGNYSVVAGHIEEKEKATDAMIREAKEEAGANIQAKNIKFAHVMHRLSNDQERIDFFFVVNSWEGEIANCEPHKCDDLSWFSLHELPNNIVPYVHSAIESWQKGIFFSEFGWKKYKN